MTKSKATTPNPKALPVAKDPSQTTEQALARAAVKTHKNSAAVMGAYQGNMMGNTLDMGELVNCLRESCESVKSGDLSDLEAMLVTQATTLQTVFASLARRAAAQEHLRQRREHRPHQRQHRGRLFATHDRYARIRPHP